MVQKWETKQNKHKKQAIIVQICFKPWHFAFAVMRMYSRTLARAKNIYNLSELLRLKH